MIRTELVASRDLHQRDQRLDAAFYCSNGAKARKVLAASPIRLQPLALVCVPEGIYIPHRFKRPYVRDPEYGVPYLTGSDIVLADPLQGCAYLSRRAGMIPDMERLVLQPGSILVTSSGDPGRAVYVNELFAGAIGSPDILRIIPDADSIPLGYLFAFLVSDIGRALLTQGTYGGVIPHIEAFHVLDLPVPRLDGSIELAIHERIEHAAAKRVEAQEQLSLSKRFLREITGIPTTFSVSYDHGFAVGSVRIDELEVGTKRLDAYHYIGHAGEIRDWRSPRFPMWPLGKLTARIFNPPIFKRIRVDDGVPYLLGAEVYETHPRPATKIARGTPNLNDYILQRDMIVFEDAGQRYGLLGTPVYIGRTLAGCAATNNMTRIVSRSREDAAYLFALLSSDYGRRLVLRHSYGTSLPHILPDHIADVPVPWPEDAQRAVIAEPILKAVELRDEANDLEDEAQDILSRALAEALPVPAPSPDGHGGG
jgi:type I restriction enzyme S subunit